MFFLTMDEISVRLKNVQVFGSFATFFIFLGGLVILTITGAGEGGPKFFLRRGSFSPKNFQLCRKIRGLLLPRILVQNNTLRLAHNMHHTDTYLRLKQTTIPHLCPAGNTTAPVCVSPREGPRREY